MNDPDETVTERPHVPTGASQAVNAYLIVLSGRSIGRMFKLDVGDYLLGRAQHVDISLEDDGVSRKHARMSRSEDGSVHLEDLNSTNGTWVNGTQVNQRELVDGDRIQVGSVTILKFSYQDHFEEKFQQQLYESVTRDALTTAYNKRVFDEQLDKSVSHSRRHGEPLSLVVLDVDHFKEINDTRGHLCGDRVLADLGSTIGGTVRNEDLFCRVGGEEFAVIMRNCTADDALRMGERLRKLVETEQFEYSGEKISLTISLGVATFDRGRHETADDLFNEADRALYAAKHQGRNRVCAGGPEQ